MSFGKHPCIGGQWIYEGDHYRCNVCHVLDVNHERGRSKESISGGPGKHPCIGGQWIYEGDHYRCNVCHVRDDNHR